MYYPMESRLLKAANIGNIWSWKPSQMLLTEARKCTNLAPAEPKKENYISWLVETATDVVYDTAAELAWK